MTVSCPQVLLQRPLVLLQCPLVLLQCPLVPGRNRFISTLAAWCCAWSQQKRHGSLLVPAPLFRFLLYLQACSSHSEWRFVLETGSIPCTTVLGGQRDDVWSFGVQFSSRSFVRPAPCLACLVLSFLPVLQELLKDCKSRQRMLERKQKMLENSW